MDQNLPSQFTEHAELTIPAFGDTKAIVLDITFIKVAESRFIEAKIVNGATYSELEYTFNEGYRQAKKHLSAVEYQITRAKKAMRQAQSEALLDRYPEFLTANKMKDSASIRDSFLARQDDYVKAQDRVDMLTAMSSLFKGKIDVFENVCRFMRKEMDLCLRSGINNNKYLTK